MRKQDKSSWIKFTGLTKCNHCGNDVYMKKVACYDQIKHYDLFEIGSDISWQEGPVWRLLLCPACSDVTLYKYVLDDRFEPDAWTNQTLYPSKDGAIIGLPSEIDKEYRATTNLTTLNR